MFGVDKLCTEPIFIITPSGRTGTTLLMSLLQQHRQIIAEPSYPYELRINQVNLPGSPLSMTDVLDYPFAELAEEKKAYLSQANRWQNGPAYYDWLSHRIGKPGGYMLEKFVGFSVDAAKAAFPGARFLISMRDPRDTLMSARSFDAARGAFGFVERFGDSDTDLVQRIARNLNILLSLTERSDCFLVKYEELVRRPGEITDGISSWLGLEPFSDIMIGNYIHHRTSPSAEASIGRWRSEMTSDLKALCTTWWYEPLTSFGYPID